MGYVLLKPKEISIAEQIMSEFFVVCSMSGEALVRRVASCGSSDEVALVQNQSGASRFRHSKQYCKWLQSLRYIQGRKPGVGTSLAGDRSHITFGKSCASAALPRERESFCDRACNLLYLNLAVQRPMTSPWQTSSALNSEPSRVR